MCPRQPPVASTAAPARGYRSPVVATAGTAMLLGCCLAGSAPAQARPPAGDSLLVSTEWLAARLEEPGLLVIEVERTPETWAAGHIPGARLVLLSSITARRGRLAYELPAVETLDSVLESVGISNDSRVIIYGNPVGASRLFFTLDYLGLGDRAAILDGGVAKWRAEGRPLVTDSVRVPPGRIEPTVDPGVLADAAWIRDHLHDSSTAFLDARSPSEYFGETVGEGISRPGHIPGAGNFFWRESLTGSGVQTLKAEALLRDEFDRLGVQASGQVVTYCEVGVQGSWIYFVARYLGFRPRLYDGSFQEWSSDTSLPVERREP